jgi:hypothetical protein
MDFYRRFDSFIVRYGIIFFSNVEQVMLRHRTICKASRGTQKEIRRNKWTKIGALDHLQHTTDSKLESMYGCFKKVWGHG